MPELYYAFLPERAGAANDKAFQAALTISMGAGALEAKKIDILHTTADGARNLICEHFYAETQNPDDQLVMLDIDHNHPANVLDHFRKIPPWLGVVGLLAYKHEEPYEPCMFFRTEDGLHVPVNPDPDSVYQCAIVGTGAISIRRWVFNELKRKGFGCPWFRYQYIEGNPLPTSEDMYFGQICEKAGINHYCDTRLYTPHMHVSWIGPLDRANYLSAHRIDMVPLDTGPLEINE